MRILIMKPKTDERSTILPLFLLSSVVPIKAPQLIFGRLKVDSTEASFPIGKPCLFRVRSVVYQDNKFSLKFDTAQLIQTAEYLYRKYRIKLDVVGKMDIGLSSAPHIEVVMKTNQWLSVNPVEYDFVQNLEAYEVEES